MRNMADGVEFDGNGVVLAVIVDVADRTDQYCCPATETLQQLSLGMSLYDLFHMDFSFGYLVLFLVT